jgi:hypothetical protein
MLCTLHSCVTSKVTASILILNWHGQVWVTTPSELIQYSLPTTDQDSHSFLNKRYSYPCNRPLGSIGLWDIEAHTFSRQSAHRWKWGCQPYALASRPLPSGRFVELISVKGWVDPREATIQLKNLTSSGIEPTTFLVVAYCLNPLRHSITFSLYCYHHYYHYHICFFITTVVVCINFLLKSQVCQQC